MSDHFQTPFPTESSRSQVFVLKTTRPTSGGQLSPVPKVAPSKPATKRVYARKKAIRRSASSRNLKENSSYSRSGPGLDDGVVNLRTKLRARRTTSFASLKDQRKGGQSDKARLSNFKSPSQVSLASPFCSRPASPDHGAEPQTASTAKRTLAIGESGDMEYSLPVCKRQNSYTLGAVLPSPIPFRPSHSPAFRKTSKKPSIGNGDLHRRPSHPTLSVEGLAERGDGRGFLLRSSPVDFNRPPSQLSLYAPLDGDDEEAPGQRPLVTGDPWVYDKRFEDELQDASTPNKRDPGLQHMSLELLSSSPRAALTTSKTEVRRSPAPEDRTLNMSLTSVEDNHLTEADLANQSPWISDSLISPPTIYLRREQAHGGHGAPSPIHAANFSETLRTDFGEGDLTGIHDIGLDANVSKKADGETAVTRDAIPAETRGPRQTFGRTRSGTIVAAVPAASSSATGRSRSGTITAAPAATKQGRGRSGTITQSSAVEMKPMVVTGRSRSGTITASRPQVSTVAPLAPISDSVLSGPEVDVHVDAHYDPTAGEDLVFSSAPNPDMEAESDDEVVLGRHSATLSPARVPGTGLKSPLSSPTDPLNIDPTKSVNLDRAWEGGEEKKKPLAKRSGSKKTDSKGSRKLNLKSLGFNSNRRGRKYKPPGETRNEPSPEREEIVAFSSDPMDLLHDFDQQDFEGPPKKRTSRAGKVKFAAPRP